MRPTEHFFAGIKIECPHFEEFVLPFAQKTENQMAIFTIPGGEQKQIPASAFVRCRPSFSWENDGHIGTTLFKPTLIVMETIEVAGPALRAEVVSFVCLKGLSNRSLWFDAKKARDAEPPKAHEGMNGVKAVVPVGGIRMRVIVSVDEAQKTIDAGRAAAGTK